MTARVSMLLKSRSSPDMLPFSLCNKKRLAIRHMNRPLFPTTLSIPSYDIGKVGRANDMLSACCDYDRKQLTEHALGTFTAWSIS